MKLTRDDVLELHDRLEGAEREISGDYLNYLASYSKREASGKGLNRRYRVRRILDRAFPERDVDLRDVRRVIRPGFHKGRTLIGGENW